MVSQSGSELKQANRNFVSQSRRRHERVRRVSLSGSELKRERNIHRNLFLLSPKVGVS